MSPAAAFGPLFRTYKAVETYHTKEKFRMFLGLFFILVVLWLMGFFAFHVAGGLIHLLLVVAVISLVLHLFRGR
jgi:hypothetical protein